GRTHAIRTSGSTGRPVEVVKTAAEGIYWHAFVLRDHMWHRRDLSRRLAAIRNIGDGIALPPHGRRSSSWTLPSASTYRTGPAFVLNITATTEEQLAWLCRVRPAYLLTLSSAARALAELAVE